MARYHLGLQKALSLKQAAVCVVPYAQTCCWRCPIEGCKLGLPNTEVNSDARWRARKGHAQDAHPDAPPELFALQHGATAGARRATIAKISAGVARRLQQLKAGEAGDHAVAFFKIPPLAASSRCKRGTRRATTKVARATCKRLAAELGTQCTLPGRGAHSWSGASSRRPPQGIRRGHPCPWPEPV